MLLEIELVFRFRFLDLFFLFVNILEIIIRIITIFVIYDQIYPIFICVLLFEERNWDLVFAYRVCSEP